MSRIQIGRGIRRRTRTAAAISVVAVLAAVPARAQEAPATSDKAPASPGAGAFTSGGEPLAIIDGQLLTVAPFAGGLSLAMKVGTTGSRIRGTTATAISGTLDLGLLGDLALLAVANSPTLGRLGIDTSGAPAFVPLPRPATADSRSTTEVDNRVALDAARLGPVVVGAGHETARAREGGPATSRTELADVRIDLGLADLLLAGGVAETSAIGTEVAGSIAYGELTVRASGTPIVSLKGVEWRVRHALGAKPQGGFSVGTASIAGMAMAAPGLASLEALASQINVALAPSGVKLQLPRLTAQGLSPLTLVQKDSSAAFKYVNPIYSAAFANAINEVEAAFVGGVPETGLAVTVANVLLAALTGRGGARVDIGGLTTSVGITARESFSYGADAPAGSSGLVPGAARVDSTLSRQVSTTSPPSLSSDGAPLGESVREIAQTVSSVVGEDLPAALLFVLGGAAIAAAWAFDRRRIAEWAALR